MTAVVTVTALYAPASRADLLHKALASSADLVLVDLEDAVIAGQKEFARTNALALLDRLPSEPGVQVRVNHPRGRFGALDLMALGAHPAVRSGRVGLRLPKVAGPEDVDLALALLSVDSPPPVHCLLESAAGVEHATAIAKHPAVAGLALGEANLALELGLRGEDAYAWVRSRVVVAAAAAGLPAPAMAVYTDLANHDGLAASCARGRALGMFGRSALHPNQLPTIASAFAPKEHELRYAREVLAAAKDAEADGAGALVLPDGRFVDAPIVESARRTIELAKQLRDSGSIRQLE